MSFIEKQSNKLMDYFIGGLLSKTPDMMERSKIELLYWYCILNIFPLVAFIPFLIGEKGFVQTGFVALTIAMLIASLYVFRVAKVYKPVLYLLAAISPIFVLALMILIVPQDLSILLTFIYITLSLVIFTINDRWAIAIVVSALVSIGISAYLNSIGIHSGALIGVEMSDPTALQISSVIKIGMPMILLALALSNFVRINKRTNNKLLSNIEIQQALNHDLAESKEQFRTLVENAEDLFYELTPQGNFKYANPAFESVTGYSPEFAKGLHFTMCLHPDATDLARKFFNQKEYITTPYTEFPIVTKTGKTVWIGQKVSYLVDKNDELIKYFCIGRDITQQKEIRANLKKAKLEAEKAAIMKAQFLSAMSHEIRTPINAVLGTIHLMADENPRADQVEHLNTLKYTADNLMNLVSHILDYNKLDTETIPIKQAPFTLKECLNHTRAGVEQFAKEKGLAFSVEMDPKLPKKLVGDSFRVSQILSNLVHNAIKFTNQGKVVIEVLEHLRTDDFVQVYFSVTDTGKGIPSKKLNDIFEKFTQATDETVLQGTGLGLTISSKIANLLGSTIQVESELGKGSKFSFLVEFQKVKMASISTATVQKGLQIKTQESLEESLSETRVLLVEDNIINQKVAGKLLKRWGAEFDVAGNGQIAVDKIQKTNYDVVLMDIQMPVMDGIKATNTIRALGGKYATIPIIALTASAVLEVRQNALEAGLNDFLTKPFQPDTLNKTIRKYIGLKLDSGEKAIPDDLASRGDIPGPKA